MASRAHGRGGHGHRRRGVKHPAVISAAALLGVGALALTGIQAMASTSSFPEDAHDDRGRPGAWRMISASPTPVMRCRSSPPRRSSGTKDVSAAPRRRVCPV